MTWRVYWISQHTICYTGQSQPQDTLLYSVPYNIISVCCQLAVSVYTKRLHFSIAYCYLISTVYFPTFRVNFHDMASVLDIPANTPLQRAEPTSRHSVFCSLQDYKSLLPIGGVGTHECLHFSHESIHVSICQIRLCPLNDCIPSSNKGVIGEFQIKSSIIEWFRQQIYRAFHTTCTHKRSNRTSTKWKWWREGEKSNMTVLPNHSDFKA